MTETLVRGAIDPINHSHIRALAAHEELAGDFGDGPIAGAILRYRPTEGLGP